MRDRCKLVRGLIGTVARNQRRRRAPSARCDDCRVADDKNRQPYTRGAASTPEARCAGSSRRKTTANSATWRSGSRITSPARQSSAYSLCDGPNLDARRGHTTFGKGSLAPANPIVWLQSGESIAMWCRAAWQGAKYVDIDCDKAWLPSDIANPEPRVQRWRLFKGITHQSMAMASATMPATIAAARVLSTWEITR